MALYSFSWLHHVNTLPTKHVHLRFLITDSGDDAPFVVTLCSSQLILQFYKNKRHPTGI